MPTEKKTNPQIQDKRKRKILFAALRTFCARGYDGTNMEDIAKAAECSHGLVYYYFKNKEEVFYALSTLTIEYGLSSHKIYVLREGKTAVESFYDITKEVLDLVVDNSNTFYYFQFAILIKMMDKHPKHISIAETYGLPFKDVKEIFLKIREEGSLRDDDIDMLVQYFLSTIAGITTRNMMFDGIDGYQETMKPPVEFVVKQFLK